MTRSKFIAALPTILYGVALASIIFNLVPLVLFANTASVIYPPIITKFQFRVWWIPFILIMSGALLYIVCRPPVGLWTHLGRGGFLFLLWFVVALFLGPVFATQHVTSARLNGTVYHLARDNLTWSMFGTLRYQAKRTGHILYSCDNYGLVCQAVHSETITYSLAELPYDVEGAYDYYNDPANWYAVPVHLEVDEAANTLSIVVDDQVVYTYSPASL